MWDGLIGDAFHHDDIVDLPTLVKKTAWNAAGYGKALAMVKSDRRQVVGADGKLQLFDALVSCVIRDSIQKPLRKPGSAQFPAQIDHNERCAMRHLAGALTHQAHDADWNIVLEGNEDGVTDGSAPPLLVRQLFPIFGAAGKGGRLRPKRLQPNAAEGLGFIDTKQSDRRAHGYAAAGSKSAMSMSVISTRRSKAVPFSSKRWQSTARMPVLIGSSARIASVPGSMAQ